MLNKQIQRAIEDAVAEVAQRTPTEWGIGVTYYLETLKRSEKHAFARGESHRLPDIRQNIQAIERVRRDLGKLKPVPPEIERAIAEHGDDKLVLLASVMTPPGWQATIRPALCALRDSIFEVFESPRAGFGTPPPATSKKKPAAPDTRSDADLAAEYRIYDNMIRFLDHVDEQGRQAGQRLERSGARRMANG